jgi:hypothetical protein
MEMELVLSCDHLPCLLCQSSLPQICCQAFNLILVQACSFRIHNAISLWWESRNKKLETQVQRIKQN